LTILGRITKAWNAFKVQEVTPQKNYSYNIGSSSSGVPHSPRRRYSSERSIISSIYNRISIDVAGVSILHVKVDKLGRYSGDMSSALHERLSLEPNIDQGPRAFRQDIVMTLFDSNNGAAALIPVDYTTDPKTGDIVDFLSLRVGEVKEWYPKHVRVNAYNEAKGIREDVLLEKRFVSIIENPLASVINEPNSTLQRLITKLNLLDEVDEATGSRKLDLIIQLPYVIKSEARKQQAEQRSKDIEFQLKNSQYGIAYTDGTEKITQLNRPAENNLLGQIEFLTNTLYDQLGITKEVMSGTADEATMLNYRSRTVEPILDAIVEAMQRSFLGVRGTTNGERIMYFEDPFKLVPLSEIASIADKFSRNEIMSANEIRSLIRMPPSTDPRAEELNNSNMPDNRSLSTPSNEEVLAQMDGIMNEVFDGLEKDIDSISGQTNV